MRKAGMNMQAGGDDNRTEALEWNRKKRIICVV